MNGRELTREECLRFAPVLERMIDIVAADIDGPTFGQAMAQAASELAIEVPEDVAPLLLICAFKIFAQRRLPGAAEA